MHRHHGASSIIPVSPFSASLTSVADAYAICPCSYTSLRMLYAQLLGAVDVLSCLSDISSRLELIGGLILRHHGRS